MKQATVVGRCNPRPCPPSVLSEATWCDRSTNQHTGTITCCASHAQKIAAGLYEHRIVSAGLEDLYDNGTSPRIQFACP